MTRSTGLVETIAEFYRADRPGALGVAVSGGSDSLGLLHLLADWGGAQLSVATVDHGLRPEAAGEIAHVADLCARLDLPHEVLTWTGWDGRGNLQDQARRTRYSMLADWARARGLGAVALGHTQDDLAETFVMRLSREAGVDGLAAMRARMIRDGMRFHRPILGLSRAELRADLAARGLRWVEDPSNDSDVFERVRARKALAVLMPLGIEGATLAAVAGQLRDVQEALDASCVTFAERHARVIAGDLVFDRTALNGAPAEIRRRLLAGALRWVAGAEYPPRRSALAQVEIALRGIENTALHGCRILVSDMTLRVIREHAAIADLRGPTDAIWDSRWRMDGPHADDLTVAALGEAVLHCQGWRETGLPRASLLASPAIWRGDRLVAAPVAGLHNGWTAKAPDLPEFTARLIAH